jgi:hypothetical protein
MRFIPFIATLLLAAPASAQQAVDLELVLAADGSGSIDEEEFRLQRQGFAAAIVSPEVLDAIQSSALQRIAVALVEWGAPDSQHVIVDWVEVRDAASAQAFADRLLAAPRQAWGYNSISNVIDFAARMIGANESEGTRKVIDVSGDGPQIGGRPLEDVRRETLAQGITINGLVIKSKGGGVRGPGGSDLGEHYERDVIGGPGAFVMTAESRRNFEQAIRAKLIAEIAYLPSPTQFASRGPE